MMGKGMGRGWLGLMVGALMAAPAPVLAGSVEFNNYCSGFGGSFRVCASVNVFVENHADGTSTVTMRVWNLETNDSYDHRWGQASTFTAIGLYHSNDAYSFDGRATLESVVYHDGGGASNITRYWGGKGTEIKTLAGVQIELASGTDTGHEGGIVGCTDPGPESADHVSTCQTLPVVPYVEFTFDANEWFALESLEFRLHAQQIGPNNEGSFKCDSGLATEEYPQCQPQPPAEVVPEPITTVLLGTGLFGVGGAALRRRRNGLEVVDD